MESEPRDAASRVLGADPVRAGRAVRSAVAVAARVRAGQADRPEVGHAVPDPHPAGRPGPGRGVLAGRATAGPAAAAPVPADCRRAGQRDGGAGQRGRTGRRAGGRPGWRAGGRREAAGRRPAPAGRTRRGAGADAMSSLGRVMAAVGRGAARLLLGERRDWIAAVWAEAHEVPSGVERLAWRAGGVWILAREALNPRRIVRAALFAAAAAAAAWAAW